MPAVRLLRLRGLIALGALLLAGMSFHASAGDLTPAGERLITHHEVGGKAAYIRKYQRPICPACATTASGVTIGIGSDLRHNSVPYIRQSWGMHPQVERFVAAQGLGGQRAIAMTRSMQDIVIPWPMAIEQFRTTGIVPYDNLARRIFGPNYDRLSPWAQDALKSLVYNRGGSMVGPARAEMRFIRDVCVSLWKVAEAANQCISRQLRAMVRIWAGGSIEAGMRRRRNDEANLAEFSKFPL